MHAFLRLFCHHKYRRMLREVAVFLCAAGIITASQIPTQTLISDSRYDIPIEAKVLQYQREGDFGPAAAYTTQQNIQYSKALPRTHAYFAVADESYSINPAIVKPISVPVNFPVAAQKVTVEGHQQVTAHPPTASYVSSQPVPVATHTVINRPAVQYVSAPVKYSQIVNPVVQSESNSAYESVTAFSPSASYVTSTLPPNLIQYKSAPEINVQPGIVKTAVPVAAKKVTIEAHQSVTAHPPTVTPVTPAPVVTYQQIDTVNRPAVRYVSAPVQVASNSFQSHETVTAFPPSASYVTSTVAPETLNYVQTTHNRPSVQYVPASVPEVKPVLVKSVAPIAPVAAKSVTVEAHQSVTAHPPTVPNSASVQYVSAPFSPTVVTQEESAFSQGESRVHYAASPVVSKPIPVPVLFSAEESPESQFAVVTKHTQAAPALISYQTPVAIAQPIPVPVIYPKSKAFIKYESKVPTPVLYSKSIVEKDHASADLVATHVVPSNEGYSRAVTFSPASQVSSVRFNGLGVSYGW